MAQKNNIKDEILELIWTKEEQGAWDREAILSSKLPGISEKVLDEMIQEDWISGNEGNIGFTERGRKAASQLIRSHRLAERLFTDVLEIGHEQMESNACTFEHILSPEVLTAICTLLGHPKECPHGSPIPPGECCHRKEKKIESVILPLSRLKSGEKGRVLYIATKHHKRLDQLIALGISPGKEVKVHQTFPSFVIKAGETDIALDNNVLIDVYVRKLNGN